LSPDPIDYNIAQIDQLLVKGSKEISLEFRCWIWGQVRKERKIMKWTTLTFKQLAAQRTLRMDPKYWIKKKKRKVRASSSKQQAPRSREQAPSYKHQASSGLTRVEGYYRMKKTNKGERT